MIRRLAQLLLSCQGERDLMFRLYAAGSGIGWKSIAEHGRFTFGLVLGDFVLDHIPMFQQDAVFNAKYVGRDPVRWRAKSRKPAMHDDKISICNNRPRFVSQGGWNSFNEVEETVTPRFYMRAVLNIVRRPVPRRGVLVAPIK
jgi:hypothetical protein